VHLSIAKTSRYQVQPCGQTAYQQSDSGTEKQFIGKRLQYILSGYAIFARNFILMATFYEMTQNMHPEQATTFKRFYSRSLMGRENYVGFAWF
jgi:hypothetical protein